MLDQADGYFSVKKAETVCVKKQGFLQGAFIIALGSFSAKVVGAITRIPLSAFLGAEGVGLYQLVYPFYCLLLTLSSSGIPAGLSRMVAAERARGEDGRAPFAAAFRLFFLLGLFGSFSMFFLRGAVSALQGEDLRLCYAALCPAVALVAGISVFRGYFQGTCDMSPTALSEFCEQAVKGIFSVGLAFLLQKNRLYAVTAVLFSVSLSEGAALFLLWRRYRAERGRKPLYRGRTFTAKQVLAVTLPASLAAAVLPLSQFLDSALCLRLMKAYSEEAVALYGLYMGGAVTLAGLPVSLCYGFAVSIIPRFSKAGGERKRCLKALAVTAAVALPCAAGLFFFARPLGAFFFRRLDGERLDVLERLLKIMSITAVTHAGAQTLAGCLIGRGKALRAAGNMTAAVALKTATEVVLVSMENISVYGMAIAANVCYLAAFVLNLISNLKKKKPENGA